MNRTTAWRLAISAACLLGIAASGRALPAAAQDAPPTITLTNGDAEAGSGKPVMFDARIVGDSHRIRFIADLSATVDAAVFTLADPYRIIIDLPDVRFALPALAGTERRGFSTAFRFGSISAGKARIVIDVSEPVTIDKSFVVEPAGGQPARLVVDVLPTTREKFLETARAYRESHGTASAEAEVVAPAALGGDAGKPVVVLDPGHGGIDLGARGDGGTLEKDVVLAFARVLGDKLLATDRYRVVYTRVDDTFVALGERVKIARQQNASLFISIHANAFPGSAIRGAIIYTVSDRASDRMAAEMADSENQSDVLAGIDVSAGDSDEVKGILFDLTRRETRNFGVVFAQNLVKELGKSTRMFKIPQQQASFKVLEAPDVPSALVELGYLTNAGDEKQLADPAWQAGSAASIVDAIDAYFSSANGTASAQP
jgi:N-acetylmuramoyl-L-alanine amidase